MTNSSRARPHLHARAGAVVRVGVGAAHVGQLDQPRRLQHEQHANLLDGVVRDGDDRCRPPSAPALVSLGPVSTSDPGVVTAELAVPHGLDTTAYDLVDVSA